MVTPMHVDGQIDQPSFVRLASHLRSKNATGLVVAGTTGEGPSLSSVEKRDLVKLAVSIAGDLKVIIGVATSSIEEAVWLCSQSQKAGATAALVMPPSFYKESTREGIISWYRTLCGRTDLPILVYNYPQRTGVTIDPFLMSSLFQIDGIVGLKDSSGDSTNIPQYSYFSHGGALFNGNETLLPRSLQLNWTGTISGAANICCEWLSEIVSAWKSNEESARTKHEWISSALALLRSGHQPMLTKAVMFELGLINTPACRLPLTEAPRDLVSSVLELLLERGIQSVSKSH